jgi:hypothetical protein
MVTHDQRRQNVEGNQFNAERMNFNQEPAPDVLYHQGKQAYKRRLYRRSEELLSKAIARGYSSGNAHYYLSLALLRGMRPSRHNATTIQSIEDNLRVATQLAEHCPHAYALWVAVKDDYYLKHGRMDSGPPTAFLRDQARGISPEHARELLFVADGKSAMLNSFAKRAAALERDGTRQLIRKYFRPDPQPVLPGPAQVKIVVGALTLSTGVALALAIGSLQFTFVALLMSVAVGVGLMTAGAMEYRRLHAEYGRKWNWANPKPSGEEMDAWLELDFAAVFKACIDGLHRDFDDLLTDPLLVFAPAASASAAYAWDDSALRFSSYQFTVILMSPDERLGIYECVYDIRTGAVKYASTYDCRFSEVYGIGTERGPDLGDRGAVDVRSYGKDTPGGQPLRISYTEVFEIRCAGDRHFYFPIDRESREKDTNMIGGGDAASRALRSMLHTAMP